MTISKQKIRQMPKKTSRMMETRNNIVIFVAVALLCACNKPVPIQASLQGNTASEAEKTSSIEAGQVEATHEREQRPYQECYCNNSANRDCRYAKATKCFNISEDVYARKAADPRSRDCVLDAHRICIDPAAGYLRGD